MRITPYEPAYAAQIAQLLNDYLPFEPEDAGTVHNAGGIRFLCVEENKVIGYIAGYPIQHITQEFPYFHTELQPLHAFMTAQPTYYTSHFVVHPHYRKRGIGQQLVQAYIDAVKQVNHDIVVVGWVQSDTMQWAAQKQFLHYDFQHIAYIPRYFEPYHVYCPNCHGMCYCDATIYFLQQTSKAV